MSRKSLFRRKGAQDAKQGALVDGRYRLGREIARGGMGAIFASEQPITERPVAIKVALGSGAAREEAEARLLREARAIATARHPGIIELLDARECDEHGPFLVLELLRGYPLDLVIERQGTFSMPTTAQIGRRLCEALAFAHERGVLHRDLKPSNVFIHRDEANREVVKLLDFGVAQMSEESTDTAKLTKVNHVVGTPEYMSPELLSGERSDERSDVYAVAVTLFECLTAQVPHSGNLRQVAIKVFTALEPPSARAIRADISEQFDAVLCRALQVRPAKRTPNMATLMDELAAVAQLSDDELPLLVTSDDDSGVVHRKMSGKSASRRRGAPKRRQQATDPIPLVTRAYRRVESDVPVRLRFRDGSEVEAKMVDISEGGMCVRMAGGNEHEGLSSVRFELPGDTGEVDTSVRYCWGGRKPDENVGLSFVDLAPDARAAIARHVESLSS
jgi:eukaryotic-like serine/threonine-protein kinase